MPKVTRTLVARGEWFDIEIARRQDLSEPALDSWESLRAVTDRTGARERRFADEHIDTTDWLLAFWQYLADNGEPAPSQSHGYNYLTDGLWEFKRGTLRIPFFDTDGGGSLHPRHPDPRESTYRNWSWPDDFERFLRLTSMFEKRSRTTPQREINFARLIRKEDLSHDRRVPRRTPAPREGR